MVRNYGEEIESDIELAGTEVLADPKAMERIEDALLRLNRNDIDEMEFRRLWDAEVMAKVELLNEMRRDAASERDGDAIRSAERDERVA